MSIDVQVLATKRDSGQQWDIGEVCEQIQLTWELEGNAGIMDTSYVEDSNLDLVEGDVISLKVDGVNLFYGWIFKKTVAAHDSVKLKVYDIKRYLAYKDVDITGNETVNQFFERVCKMMNIKYKVVHTSDYIIPTKIHDGETYNNMLQYAIDQTFIGTGLRFCVRANGDTLELLECSQLKKDVIIGDKSLLTDFEFSTDIENTYTAFKVQREVASQNQKKKKQEISEVQKIVQRKTLVAQNAENVKRWGVLQYYEKKDSKWTDAQLAKHLELLQSAYGKQTKSLKVEALGHTDCIPGNMIPLLISDLEKEKVAQGTYALITSATHTISHDEHTMNLDVEVG